MMIRDYVKASIIVLLIYSLIISTTSAAYSKISKPIIDKNVHEKLTSQERVKVSIIFEDREALLRIKDSISNEELSITYIAKKGRWLSGFITNEGLDKLSKMSEVYSIYYPRVAKLTMPSSIPLIDVDETWSTIINNENITGSNITICVIDSGVDKENEVLIKNLKAEYCFCNISDTGCCPNGETEDANATDEYGHGTRVVGVLGYNSYPKGVALDSDIVAVRVTDKEGNVNDEDISKAIDWCTYNKDNYSIDIITLSASVMYYFDDPYDCELITSTTDVNNAVENGILVTVSSGNEGNSTHITVPACAINATSVGSSYDYTDIGPVYFNDSNCTEIPCQNNMTCFTNRGNLLDIIAPGYEITTINISDAIVESGGTSLSTPIVAGVSALLMQYWTLKEFDYEPIDVENRLIETGELISDEGKSMNNNPGSGLVYPLINAYAALFPLDVLELKKLETTPTNNIFGFRIGNNYNNKTKNISWSFDLGNGTIITSSENVSLGPKEEVFVYFENVYNDGNIYEINSTAYSGELSDSETMTTPIGNVVAYGLESIFQQSMQRVFRFITLNNFGDSTGFNWTMETGEGSLSGEESVYLGTGDGVFVYVAQNYSSPGAFAVNASSFNESVSDSAGSIEIAV